MTVIMQKELLNSHFRFKSYHRFNFRKSAKLANFQSIIKHSFLTQIKKSLCIIKVENEYLMIKKRIVHFAFVTKKLWPLEDWYLFSWIFAFFALFSNSAKQNFKIFVSPNNTSHLQSKNVWVSFRATCNLDSKQVWSQNAPL